ncbi:MAG: hypothetical protein WAU34_14355, partial [Desulfobacterales bacterium]
LFGRIIKQRKGLKFELGPPDSTQSTDMAVSLISFFRRGPSHENLISTTPNHGLSSIHSGKLLF